MHPVTSSQLLALQQTFFYTSLATAGNQQLTKAAIIQLASGNWGCQIPATKSKPLVNLMITVTNPNTVKNSTL